MLEVVYILWQTSSLRHRACNSGVSGSSLSRSFPLFSNNFYCPGTDWDIKAVLKFDTVSTWTQGCPWQGCCSGLWQNVQIISLNVQRSTIWWRYECNSMFFKKRRGPSVHLSWRRVILHTSCRSKTIRKVSVKKGSRLHSYFLNDKLMYMSEEICVKQILLHLKELLWQ